MSDMKPRAQRKSLQLFCRVTPKMKMEVEAKAAEGGYYISEVVHYLVRKWLQGEIPIPEHAIK